MKKILLIQATYMVTEDQAVIFEAEKAATAAKVQKNLIIVRQKVTRHIGDLSAEQTFHGISADKYMRNTSGVRKKPLINHLAG